MEASKQIGIIIGNVELLEKKITNELSDSNLIRDYHRLLNNLEKAENTALISKSNRLAAHLFTRITLITLKLLKYISQNNISEDDIDLLLLDRRLIVAAIDSSGFLNGQYARGYFLDYKQVELVSYKDFLIHILISSIDEIPESLLSWVLNSDDLVASKAALSLISDRVVFGKLSDDKRTKLFEKTIKLKNIKYNEFNLNAIARAWMYCSYSTCENKHKYKIYYNQWLRGYGEAIGLNDFTFSGNSRNGKNKKIKLVVIAEILFENHVMWRAHGERLRQLIDAFEVILLCRERDVSESIRKEFDKTIIFNTIEEAYAGIKNIMPDAIYYPSIGMRTFTLILANFRLARHQFVAMGHPATTNIKHMDYVVVPKTFHSENDSNEFSEKVLYIEQEIFGLNYLEHKNYLIKNNYNIGSDLKIAIIGKSFKISSVFLEFLDRLFLNLSKKYRVKYIFFPNEAGVFLYQMIRKLESRYKNCEIRSSSSYNDYANRVSNCDIAISTFPFGQASGIFDCIAIGLPLFELKGNELHERIGSNIYNEIGLENILSSDDKDRLEEKIINFLDSSEIRKNYVDLCLSAREKLLKINNKERNNESFALMIEKEIINSGKMK